ncbi:hypothetical protein ACTFIW_003364 [Dictyostelium discoideum]
MLFIIYIIPRFKKVKLLYQQPINQDGRNQESPINGQTSLLHGKTRYKKTYLYMLVDPQYRYLFSFVLKGSHYRWKTMSFGLSTAHRIFTMLSRPVLRMLRYIRHRILRRSINRRFNKRRMFIQPQKENGFTCQTMFQVKYRKEFSQNNSINYFSQIANRFGINETSCSQRKEEKCHQGNNWLTVLKQWNGKEISLFPSYDYVLTIDASESGAGATLKKGNKIIKTWSFQWSTIQSNMLSNHREMIALLMAYQALWWSDTGPISSVLGPVINAKEQRKYVLSILELTSLDDTNSQVFPVRHLVTYLRASKGRRKPIG